MSELQLFNLENVSFAYGSNEVINHLDLELQAGCFYGIVGPNGCGKTTLLDLLTGCKQPRTGAIRLKDKPLGSYSKRHLAKQLALVPQEFDIGFGFTVEETVMMGRHPHIARFASPSQNDWYQVERAMDLIGVTPLRNHPINALSGGQKQRAIVARALAQDTPVILFDEATSSLDVKYTLQIFNIARQLVSQEGRTVVAVVHNLNLAAAFCEKIIFIKDGSMAHFGPVAETMTPETIKAVFDVQAEVVWNSYSKAHQVNFNYGQ